jgi:hypothetical protein
MPLFGRPNARDDQRALAYGRWLQQRNPLAIVSLVLGVFSLIELGVLVLPGVAGIMLGIIALKQLKQAEVQPQDLPPGQDAPSPAKTRGHRIAWSGIALSAISLVLAAILYMAPGRAG